MGSPPPHWSSDFLLVSLPHLWMVIPVTFPGASSSEQKFWYNPGL